MKKIILILMYLLLLNPVFVFADNTCNTCIYSPKLSCGKDAYFYVNNKVIITEGKVKYLVNESSYMTNTCKSAIWNEATYNVELAIKSSNFATGCEQLYYFDSEKKAYQKSELNMTLEQIELAISSGEVQILSGMPVKKITCQEEVNAAYEKLAEQEIERTCVYEKDKSKIIITVKEGKISISDNIHGDSMSIDDFKEGCPPYLSSSVGNGTMSWTQVKPQTSYRAGYYTLTTLNNQQESQPEDENYKEITGCDSLLGDPKVAGTSAYYLQTAFNIIKYLALIILAVLTATDFIKAIMGDEKDLKKELTRKLMLRLIYAICIFFIPTIVKVILTLTDVYAVCGIN